MDDSIHVLSAFSHPSLQPSFVLLAVLPWPVYQRVAVAMGGDKLRRVACRARAMKQN